MCKVYYLLLLLLLKIILIKSYNISSCIPNTPCQCYLTQYSLTLFNCSHTLSDLPIFNSKTTPNITKVIARNTFNQWPIQLCKYSNIQILDLSGSFFNSQLIDFSCLNSLIHLNLSNSQLNYIPKFRKHFSNHLQLLDLSNNNIKNLDGKHFQSLPNLISLFLQNNPIETIENIQYLFNLTNLASINLISTNLNIHLEESLTINQWISLANQWNKSSKIFLLRMNNIPLQNIIPYPEQFESISQDLMKIILKTFINSSFLTLFNTPKCDCIQLRNYQRIFSLIDYQKKYTSPLFQSVQCLLSDGVTHARLFDRRTIIDLQCPTLGRMSFFPSLKSSAMKINYQFEIFLTICFILLY